MPTSYLPGLSAYVSSKLAQGKVYEFLAAENPGIFVATVDPGMVETATFNRTGATVDQVPIDTGMLPLRPLARPLTANSCARKEADFCFLVQLPAHFLVWMASPEAEFLRGRCAWANWDVDELKALKEKYSSTPLFMTAGFKGHSLP